ncbi:MAG: TolC family protein [Spirochaetota bacterium]
MTRRFAAPLFLGLVLWAVPGGIDLKAQPYDHSALVEAALYRNPAHRGTVAEVERAREQLRGAKAERLPTLSVSAGLGYLFNPIEPVRVTSEELAEVTGVPTTEGSETITLFEGQEDTQYQFAATIEQPVYTWGKIAAGVQLAEVGATAASLQVERSSLQIETEVASLYYSLHYLSLMHEELQRQEEAARRLVEISRRSFESGAIVESDLLEARVQAAEVSLAIAEVESRIDQSIARLAAATGLPVEDPEDLALGDVSDLSRSATLEPASALVGRATSGSTELALLESQVQAAELRRDLAEGGSYFKPDIGLQVELQFAGPRFPFIERDWYRQDQPNNVLSLGLQTTLFDGGRISSEIATERLDVGAARLDVADGRAKLERAVRETRARVVLDRARVEQARLQEENARVQLDLRKREWDNGTGTESDYLKQVIDRHGKTAEKHQRALEFHLDYFQLRAATGDTPAEVIAPEAGSEE